MSPRHNRRQAHDDEVHDSHRELANKYIYLSCARLKSMNARFVIFFRRLRCTAHEYMQLLQLSKKKICYAKARKLSSDSLGSGYRCKKPNEASDVGESQKIKSLKVQCVVLLFFFSVEVNCQRLFEWDRLPDKSMQSIFSMQFFRYILTFLLECGVLTSS